MPAATVQGPPFDFDGVTVRVFPLRAHAHALQRLCDTYLNHDPDQIYFRPSAPYAVLALLNYGRMSYTSEASAHYGWVSQNEVYFGAPVDWRRRDKHGRITTGVGIVAPFIFVDQAWSIQVGREVYGWPKMPAAFRREVNTWASGSPAARENLLTLTTETYLTPYASERPSAVPLVEINRAAPLSIGPSLWQAPLDIANPWWGMMTLWRESMRAWSPTGLSDLPTYIPLLMQSMRLLFGGASPNFYTANLKQVRSLEDPTVAAYQAITMAPMQLTALHRAGALGEGRVLRGDPTGGYRVRVQRHPLFPIVETLGLLVSEEDMHADARDAAIRGYTAGVEGNTRLERFPDGLTSGDDIEHGVTTLAPLFPFWLEADLRYGTGETITWRDLPGGVWNSPIAHAAAAAAGIAPTGASDPLSSTRTFDATWGARGVPAPPYYYPQLTMRFLALEVTSAQALDDAIAQLAPPDAIGSLEPYRPPGPDGERGAPFVIMMITTSEEMGAQTNSAGWWWKRQISFYVPVIWRSPHQRATAAPGSVALLSMLTFADSKLAATTSREIGPEVIAAELTAPPDAWLDHAGPLADRRLLWLATNVLPAIDVDAEAKQRILLELLSCARPGTTDRASATADVRPPDIAADGMTMCVLARRRVRDATDPATYAYEEWFAQHMVARSAPDHHPWQSGPQRLELRIHQYPDELDLVGQLALHVAELEHTKSPRTGRGWEGATVNVIPTDFTWATLSVTQERNTSLAVRSHGGLWHVPQPALPRPVLSATPPAPPPPPAGAAPPPHAALEQLLAHMVHRRNTP